MFVHISPKPDAVGETTSTLKFAERVATVELGAACVNKDSSNVKELKEEVRILIFAFNDNKFYNIYTGSSKKQFQISIFQKDIALHENEYFCPLKNCCDARRHFCVIPARILVLDISSTHWKHFYWPIYYPTKSALVLQFGGSGTRIRAEEDEETP
ncbi:P-loop nucleoside triphosphate hydrolase superfamily protein with CH (Calponin-like proteiny) domain [Abeliophyllum distichum]|uniref:P-loop nucleoside triphosphate hydrolase superfamily protein with CH (Calponin-like proteiny) domain n=1 Tax=Abeliophyllum distichum TaxID=126358 RepID=A0ABD1PRN2_9LAMI